MHKYLYANANPISYVDPSGYISVGEAVATSVLIGILGDLVFPDAVLSPTNSEDIDADSPWAQRLLFEIALGSISLRNLPSLAYSLEDEVLVPLGNLASGVPRNFGAGFLPLDVLSRSAQLLDKGGLLTKAGRALQKHANRIGSAFPLPKGNESVLNRVGQDVVDDILSDPGTVFTKQTLGRYGEVIDAVAPDGRGIRYSTNGDFIGFLEP